MIINELTQNNVQQGGMVKRNCDEDDEDDKLYKKDKKKSIKR